MLAARGLAATGEAYSKATTGRQRPKKSHFATRLPLSRGLRHAFIHFAWLYATRFALTASCPALTAARSAAANGASGGLTRASAGSPWICASNAFTPDTSGRPSNSLRMATAASSAAASPCTQARAHRSALRLAVAEMQPAKSPRPPPSGSRLGRGKHGKLASRSPPPSAHRPCRRRNPSDPTMRPGSSAAAA